jgi:hypothetical protein
VNQILDLNLKGVDYERSLSLKVGRVALDLSDYLKRYLNKNAAAESKSEFLKEYELREPQLLRDCRFQIQGHDYVALLSWYIHKHRGFSRIDQDTLGRELFSCLELEDLVKEPLFQSLINRLGRLPHH